MTLEVRLLVAISILVGYVPSKAFSETPIPVSECQFMQSYGGETYYEDHTDIGGGFIMYAERSEYGVGITVADCFSGLTLDISSGDDEEKHSLEAFQKSTEQTILDFATSPKHVTLSMIEKHFSTRGIWTNLANDSIEHCACAAFYPEAKGMKEDWIIRYMHP